MSIGSSGRQRRTFVAVAFVGMALCAACSSSKSGTANTDTSVPTASVTNGEPSSIPAAATTHTSKSCTSLEKIVSPVIGGAAETTSLADPPEVSCQFASDNGSIVYVKIGPGTAADLASARTASGGGGRTITAIHGLGSSAFAITKDGQAGGVVALSPHGTLVSVESTLTLAQDEALARKLLAPT